MDALGKTLQILERAGENIGIACFQDLGDDEHKGKLIQVQVQDTLMTSLEQINVRFGQRWSMLAMGIVAGYFLQLLAADNSLVELVENSLKREGPTTPLPSAPLLLYVPFSSAPQWLQQEAATCDADWVAIIPDGHSNQTFTGKEPDDNWFCFHGGPTEREFRQLKDGRWAVVGVHS